MFTDYRHCQTEGVAALSATMLGPQLVIRVASKRSPHVLARRQGADYTFGDPIEAARSPAKAPAR